MSIKHHSLHYHEWGRWVSSTRVDKRHNFFVVVAPLFLAPHILTHQPLLSLSISPLINTSSPPLKLESFNPRRFQAKFKRPNNFSIEERWRGGLVETKTAVWHSPLHPISTSSLKKQKKKRESAPQTGWGTKTRKAKTESKIQETTFYKRTFIVLNYADRGGGGGGWGGEKEKEE